MGMIKSVQPKPKAKTIQHEGNAIKKRVVLEPESYTLCGDTANVTIIQESKKPTHTKLRKL